MIAPCSALRRLSRPLRTGACLAWLLAAALPVHALDKAQTAPRKPAANSEIADKQADLGELRQRIDSLRKELHSSEESRADAADKLRDSEKRISNLQRELRELGEQRGQTQQRLRQLEQQSRDLGQTLGQQQGQLEKMLYRQYLRGNHDTALVLLNGDNPNQLARDLYYLSSIGLARAELIGEIHATLDRKKALAADAKERAEELAENERQQQQRHSELKKQQDERKAIYGKISDKVSAQRKEIGNLQQNEKRLSQLIDRLSRLLAQQAAAAAARPKPKPSTPAGGDTGDKPRPTPGEAPRQRPNEVENSYEPVAGVQFAGQQGRLRLPARGSVVGRFNGPREGGGTWRGIFIKAAAGSDVKAIANGRVVFADWMRGFGNLLIIDHGDAYLTIYGNNDALLKQVGQMVKGGDTVASVGNSGGNPESGLYFEIRHQGQPVDPMKWASVK